MATKSKLDKETLLDVYNNEYFKINKVLQETTGLWPYRSRFDKFIRRFIVLFVLGVVSVPHANGIRVWCGKHMGICAENISGVVYAMGVFLKYFVTILSEDKISKVYEQVAENWLTMNDPQEKAIMEEYAKIGYFKSVGYVGYLTIAGITFSQLGMLPILMDFVIPLNESRPKLRVVKAEFFVDPYDFYYEIYFTYCVITVVSVTVLMSIDTMYTAVVHQNLGIFNVIKHRLNLATKRGHTKDDYAYKTFISAIQLHKESLQFSELLETTYETCFLILIFICVTFLTFGAVTIMENASEILDLIRMTMFEFGTAVHLFYLSWPGELVISESSELFLYVYMNEWYNVSERAKTLMKIMMVRCMKPCCLTAGGLYIMNFENYGSIIKSTMSYITVVASFR